MPRLSRHKLSLRIQHGFTECVLWSFPSSSSLTISTISLVDTPEFVKQVMASIPHLHLPPSVKISLFLSSSAWPMLASSARALPHPPDPSPPDPPFSRKKAIPPLSPLTLSPTMRGLRTTTESPTTANTRTSCTVRDQPNIPGSGPLADTPTPLPDGRCEDSLPH